MSVVYEVNVDVDEDIADQFQTWLHHHIKEMIAIPGFTGAFCAEVEKTDANEKKRKWTIQYRLVSRQALEDYFTNHAARMRADGLARFPGKFTAIRRIYQNGDSFLPAPTTVTLRYFSCRGRAEAHRLLLEDAGVNYTEHSVSLEEWPQMSGTRDGGPFQLLPVLEWEGTQISQTETIGFFLSQRLTSQTSPEQYDTSFSLISSAYTDVLSPLMALMWAPIRTPSATVPELLGPFIARVKKTLLCWNQIIGEKDYFGGAAPSGGDFFVFDVLLELGVFGAALLDINKIPNLVRFVERMGNRHRIAEYLRSERRKPTLTKSTKEAEVSAQIQNAWVW
eukprot:c248_g1_i1.p1 GENE.c248_g1_i1~~c248_g1_i1.p1  ORF type:complete len:349 (+),score=95.06 c248_g1_i1:42-1049(+)